jgi:two-component system, LytTR family, sensor histidine kinase AlgZ
MGEAGKTLDFPPGFKDIRSISSAMGSISQNANTSALPNFRNLGILLRILVIVNVLAIGTAVARAPTLRGAWGEFVEMSGIVQPVVIVTVLALAALNDWLQRLRYALGAAAVVVLAVGVTVLVLGIMYSAYQDDAAGSLQRSVVLTLLTTAILLVYFDLRGRALSPAIAEARLQALQARIRPHFLYNSINAVLSLIRQDPRRAETALEDLADLFRVVMGDSRELSPIAREVELCRQYLELEQLRLGDRLKVAWRIDNMPRDALVPPLLLQPLLENAVYHGIEPRVEPGEISIDIYSSRSQVHAVLRNPYAPDGKHRAGNRMALANIRERLQLHFDAEATLDTRIRENMYQVHITLPYVKAPA